MGIKITEHTREWAEAVGQFNERLEAGGKPIRFPTSPIPQWLPKTEQLPIYQEYFVALDDDLAVRGAYILKHQEFRVAGRSASMAFYQLPISEGIVDPHYSRVGVRLLMDAQRRQPLLFALGGMGEGQVVKRMLQAAGWHFFAVPFFFRIVHPYRFLRNIVHLRRSAPRRLGLDVLALTGLGWLGVKLVQFFQGIRAGAGRGVEIKQIAEFSAPEDDLWDRCKDRYGMVAVRDADVLRALYPGQKDRLIRLRFRREGRLLGWAVVVDTEWTGHNYFGDMRLGSIVDGLSLPEDAPAVVQAATTFLRRRGVDLVVSNQSHSAWCGAMASAGFIRGPSNYFFGAAKKLTALLRDSGLGDEDIYLNRDDGDESVNL